jgi:hypothetical protein
MTQQAAKAAHPTGGDGGLQNDEHLGGKLIEPNTSTATPTQAHQYRWLPAPASPFDYSSLSAEVAQELRPVASRTVVKS